MAFGTIPFLLNTIILTASRSALLGMIGAGAVALWMAPKRHRRVVYASAVLDFCAPGALLYFLVMGHSAFTLVRLRKRATLRPEGPRRRKDVTTKLIKLCPISTSV